MHTVPLRPSAVVICDDHPLIRAGMASAVATEPGLIAAQQVADLDTAAAALAEHPEAVLIVRDTLLRDSVPPPVGLVIGVNRMSGGPVVSITTGGVLARGTISAINTDGVVPCPGVPGVPADQAGRHCSTEMFYPDIRIQLAGVGVRLNTQ